MFRSLTIKNFRCFRDFTIGSLERVNLIAGMNDAGKTALLEAIYLLLGETNLSLVVNANAFRGLGKIQGDVHAISEWVCTPLFHNFDTRECIEIEGKSSDESLRRLRLKHLPRAGVEFPTDSQRGRELTASVSGVTSNALEIEYVAAGKSRTAKLIVDEKGIRVEPTPPAPAVPGYFLAARTTTIHEEDARNYGQLEVEKEPFDLVSPLQILEPRLTRLRTLLGAGGTLLYGDVGLSRMLPLGLLGDGLARLTSILVKMATAAHGVVLVDDLDSGFHYSVLQKVWTAIAEAARRFDVQLVSTTHSYECVRAAHAAFSTAKKYDFRLQRLDRVDDEILVATYNKRTLRTSIEMNLEVR